MSEDNIQLPDYLCFKPSKTKIGQNGLFTTRTLQANEPLGIYRGKIRRILPQTADEEYVWAVLSARGVPVFYIDASNPNDGNFLRFIRWTHEKSQQNVVCMQQNQQIHYFTLRTIEADEELLTFIERQKSKKREKRENGRTRRETRQQQSTQHQDNPAIKILEQEPGSELVDDDNVHLVMNNRSLEFELQITKKFLSETLISDGVKQTCLKCDICHQIFMSNVAFKFHYHTYHITPQYLSPANRPRAKIRDLCNICRFSSIANDVKSVMVDLLEVVAGGQRLEENRYPRLHIYRCHWCAPIDAHYNTAKQLSQHVRSKHYRLLQALLATQANRLQNGNHSTRGKRTREAEDEENSLNANSPSSLNSDRQRQRASNVLQSSANQDMSARLPIPIGLPDPLTDRDCQQLFTIGEQVAYNLSNCIDGTLEDIKQNETFCRQQMDDEEVEQQPTAIEHFLGQYPLVRDLLGPRRRHDTVIQHLSDDYFDHPKNQSMDLSKYYQRQKSIPERRFIMNRYACILCSERFLSPLELIEHEKLVHEKSVSRYDWGWNSSGLLQSNPYGFILELESELKQQQQRTKSESPSLFMNNHNLKKKSMRQRSTSSNERSPLVQLEDVKPTIQRTPSKRVKRDIQRSNTYPVMDSVSPREKDDVRPGQRKSKRLRKSTVHSPETSPSRTPELVEPKKELITTMKRPLPSSLSTSKESPNQIIVKTDKRYYWCTKCSKVYLNLISLYTESHYRQCVGENQHFNVTEDPTFFTDEEIQGQLPSSSNSDQPTPTTSSSEEAAPATTRRKESIFFSKTSDDSRTYFINGKPIRMSSINRPLTVKDLRQQFHQQSAVTIHNPSEEYIYQQRALVSNSAKSRRTTDTTVKPLPAPRSLDRFGISSDDDDDDDEEEEQEEEVEEIKPVKSEVEKTLVKRRYDSDYASSIDTDDQQGNKRRNQNTRSNFGTSASLKRSLSQQQGTKSASSWKSKTEDDSASQSSASSRSQVPDSLKGYDHVCSKCNMPFVSQDALDEHQNGQCLEMNVLASCGSWFRCPLCSLTYCDAHLMSLHINKTHRDVLKNNQRAQAQRRSNSRQLSASRSTSANEHHHLRKYS